MIPPSYTLPHPRAPQIATQSRLFAALPFRSDAFHRVYAVAPGDNRFMFFRSVGAPVGAKPASLVLVENWFEELKQRPAAKK